MELDRKELKDKAAQLIRGNYWNMAASGFVMSASSGTLLLQNQDVLLNTVSYLFGPIDKYVNLFLNITALVLYALVMFPLVCGCAGFFMKSSRETADLSVLLDGYKKDNWLRVIRTELYRMGMIVLHFLLLIIPGIMCCYDYYFVLFLILEYPEKNARELCALSKQKARGRRRELFAMDVSFLLWWLSDILTYGLVGVFYYIPYRNLTISLAWRALCEEEAMMEPKPQEGKNTAETKALAAGAQAIG